MKNCGILLTLLFGICSKLQPCKAQLGIYIFLIAIGAVLALWSNPEFNIICMLFAFLAVVFGAMRWTLTQYALQIEKISVVNLVLFLSPSATIFTFIASLYVEKDRFVNYYNSLNNPSLASQFLEEFIIVSMCGGLFALLLLIVEFKLIHHTSALTTDVIAKIKDILLIGMAVIVYDEKLSITNIFGLLLVFCGILLFAKFKHNHQNNNNNTILKSQKYEQVNSFDVDDDDDDIDDDNDNEQVEEEDERGIFDVEMVTTIDRFAAI